MLMTQQTADRYDRYKDIVTKEQLQSTRVTIAGVGAIGYAVARIFCTMGVGQVNLVDPDTIETANLGTQGWIECSVDNAKVKQADLELRSINSSCEVETFEERFRPSLVGELGIGELEGIMDVVVLTVDSITDRTKIFGWVSDKPHLIIDARMGAETLFWTSFDPRDAKQVTIYKETLFRQEDAFRVPGCTQPSTYFTAQIAAGVIAAAYSRFVRGYPPAQNVLFNILAMQLEQNVKV